MRSFGILRLELHPVLRVLFSGGFCLLFLSLLYWTTEVRHWHGRWTMPILVFGMNAIAGFVADSLIYGSVIPLP